MVFLRLQPKAIAKSLAWTTGILYALCTLVVVYFPDLALGIAGAWYHGLGDSTLATVTLESFITGIVTAMASAFVAGYLFAGFTNYFAIKK